MIRRVKVKNFKRFLEQEFVLDDAVVLAGPNNAGKSTLLQAITSWRLGLDRWVAQRKGGTAAKRSGVAISRADFTSVPLRETNLLWESRKVTGPKGMSGVRRLIEITVQGEIRNESWECGIEVEYANPDLVYVRPCGAKELDLEEIREFPPLAATNLDIVHVPTLSGIERDEPRRDRGLQDLLVGLGQPGHILRNLLLEIAEKDKPGDWNELVQHIRDCFEVELLKPVYLPNQPHIVCEYRETNWHQTVGKPRPLDLSNAGSGTLQVLLLLAFLYARPASVILLDEPDAHQHIILQKQVYDLIRAVARKRGGQVIIATHSEVVLDATPPTQVLGFFGGQSSPRPLLDRTDRDRFREALKRVTTTDLLQGQETNSIFYLEDQTDAKILRAWAHTLNHPASFFLDRSFIHPLGGRKLKEARDHYFAMQAVCPDIRAVCLLDGDNKGEASREHSQRGVTILRWKRYEIENYLLLPQVIGRFLDELSQPKSEAGQLDLLAVRIPVEDLPRMKKKAEKLFWDEVPRGADLHGNNASLVRVKASEEFIVPMLEKLGINMPKRDLYLLAEHMQEDEIHPEVVKKLDHIAQALDKEERS